MLKKNNIILDIHKKDECGIQPLMYAITNSNIDIVKILVEYATDYQIVFELNEFRDGLILIRCAPSWL